MTTKIKLRKMSISIVVTMAFLFLGNASFAQDSLKSKEIASNLSALNGFTQIFYYSPQYEKRANDIAIFIEDAGKYFQQQIKFTPKTKLYILGPEHWKDFAAQPVKEMYGFPHNPDKESLVIAVVDNDFWRSFLPPIGQLPPNLAVQVTKAYGKPDGSHSMMPFFDLLALHELGHSYTSQAKVKTQRHWLEELFVNIMLHTYVAENQPELLLALETFPNMVVGAGASEYKYTSLQDFEKLYTTMGMGAKNYGWYQTKLHVAAKNIYNVAGKKLLPKLWEALRKHPELMTDEELVNMLKSEVDPSVANVFVEWNEIK